MTINFQQQFSKLAKTCLITIWHSSTMKKI